MKKLMAAVLSLIVATTACICTPCSITTFASEFIVVEAVDRDITDSLRKALAKAKNGSTNVYVYVPAGDYVVTKGINIYSNTYLDMTGATITRDPADTGIMLRVGTYDSGATGEDYYHDITIHGGTLNANGAYAQCTGGIFTADHTSNLNIENVTFKDTRDSHHITIAGCKDVNITGCHFEGSFRSKDKNTNMEAIQLDILQENHYKTGQAKSYDGTMNKNISITNNTFDDVNRGVGSHSVFAGAYMDNINISSNTFTNIGGYAISAAGMHGATINGNTMTNCGSGIFFRTVNSGESNNYPYKSVLTKDTGSVISGNRILICEPTDSYYNVVPYGIKVYGIINGNDDYQEIDRLPDGDYRVYNLTIASNSITFDSNGYGIWTYGAVGTSIKSNAISYINDDADEGTSHGIKCEESTSQSIAYNRLNGNGLGCTCNGIYLLSSSTGSIVSNTVTGFDETGILVDTFSCATIKGNTSTKNSDYGICVRNSSAGTLSSNTVKGNYGDGIGFVNNTATCTSTGDTVASNKASGIFVKSARLNIKSPSCSSNKYGIYVCNSSKVSISGGTVASNKRIGIYYLAKSSGSIKKTKVKKNRGYGIYIAKSAKKVGVSKVKYSKNKGGKIFNKKK